MKISRILTLPFALVADVVSLGNIGGDRSFTQQVFDAEERERSRAYELALLERASAAIVAERAQKGTG